MAARPALSELKKDHWIDNSTFNAIKKMGGIILRMGIILTLVIGGFFLSLFTGSSELMGVVDQQFEDPILKKKKHLNFQQLVSDWVPLVLGTTVSYSVYPISDALHRIPTTLGASAIVILIGWIAGATTAYITKKGLDKLIRSRQS